MVNNKVFVIKFIHSIIFYFIVLCLFYILYCAIVKNYNWTLLVALGAIFLEGLILLLYRWQCPLTILAQKYGDEKGTVTDILLPTWLVPHTFKIFTVVFSLALVLLGFGYFT